MDLSWILLALFLIAIISGTVKSLSRSMLRNILRLVSVVVAYAITLALQICGVFQSVVATVMGMIQIDLGYESALALLSGLAGTIITPILFVIAFVPILIVLRIIVFIVVKIVEKNAAKKEKLKAAQIVEESNAAPSVTEAPETVEAPEAPATVEATEATETAEAAEDSETDDDTETSEDADADAESDESEESSDAEESAENVEETHTSPEVTDEKTVEEKSVSCATELPKSEIVVNDSKKKESAPKKRKKIKGIYDECGWRRLVSILSGMIGGVLVLAVLLLPMTYLMGIFTTATAAIHDSDADDSPIYQAIDVVDDYIIAPYEKSFVSSFYSTYGVTDLLNFTARAGGKIVLEDGNVVYADDVLKGVIYNGVSAAAQITSAKSECKEIRNNVNAIVNDPMLSTILADVVVDFVEDYNVEEVEDGDIAGGLIANFVDYYKNADKDIIRHDLAALADAVGVLAEQKIVAQFVGGNVDFESMLKDGETLANLVEAISGLSSFGPTIESAFELGINILGETLMIPENDAVVYDNFIDDVLTKMVKTNNTQFDINAVKYYIYNTEKNGLKANSSNGIAGYSQFSAYVAQWERVQSAFAHASEDRSYGYFTMDINGVLYIYDSTSKSIVKYSEENKEQYENKISPVSGLINALTLYSSTNQLTVENLYTILTAYTVSSTDEASVALANKMLNKDSYVAEAVTIEKLLAATDFTDWTEAEKATDSRLCVEIIVDLLDIVETFSGGDVAGDIDAALVFVDMFTKLGSTMDIMQKTSCINELPPLLIEGLIKNEMLADFLKPSIVFQMNDIVKNNDRSYYDCMNQIAVNIRFAINALGGDVI